MTKNEITKRVYTLYRENKNDPIEQRMLLAESFFDELLEDGYSREAIYKIIVTHPDKLSRRRPLLEVLADFVLRLRRNGEKCEEYPILSISKIAKDEAQRKELEIPLDDVVEIWLGHATYISPRQCDVEQMVEVIRDMKGTADAIAQKYATGEPWNAREALKKERGQPYKKRTVTRIRNRILELDEGRVRECPVCYTAFYASDLRQKYCSNGCYLENKRK